MPAEMFTARFAEAVSAVGSPPSATIAAFSTSPCGVTYDDRLRAVSRTFS